MRPCAATAHQIVLNIRMIKKDIASQLRVTEFSSMALYAHVMEQLKEVAS